MKSQHSIRKLTAQRALALLVLTTSLPALALPPINKGTRPPSSGSSASTQNIDPCLFASESQLKPLVSIGLGTAFPVKHSKKGKHVTIKDPQLVEVNCPNLNVSVRAKVRYKKTRGVPQYSTSGKLRFGSKLVTELRLRSGVTEPIVAGDVRRAFACLNRLKVTRLDLKRIPNWLDNTWVRNKLNEKLGGGKLCVNITSFVNAFLQQGGSLGSSSAAARRPDPSVSVRAKIRSNETRSTPQNPLKPRAQGTPQNTLKPRAQSTPENTLKPRAQSIPENPLKPRDLGPEHAFKAMDRSLTVLKGKVRAGSSAGQTPSKVTSKPTQRLARQNLARIKRHLKGIQGEVQQTRTSIRNHKTRTSMRKHKATSSVTKKSATKKQSAVIVAADSKVTTPQVHYSDACCTHHIKALRGLGSGLDRDVKKLQGHYRKVRHKQGLALATKMVATVNRLNTHINAVAGARDAARVQGALNDISNTLRLLQQNLAKSDACCI